MTDMLAHIALGLALGFALGIFHFATLNHVTRLYLGGGAPARAVALQLARLALVAGLMVGLAFLGAAPLIAGTGGLILARAVVLRRVREET